MIICYENARIFTGNGDPADCMVVRDGRFEFVGQAGVARKRFPDAERIDLEGRFVCPGFNDSHMHLLSLGGSLAQAQLAGHTSSLSGVLEAVSRFARSHPDRAWILGRGWNQDYFTDTDRFPNRYDLDNVCPDKPCMITRACGHIAVANTRALELAGISAHAPEISGGSVYTDSQDIPTGVLAENAISLVSSLIPKPTRNEIKHRLSLAMAHVNSFGITSVHSDDFSSADVPFEEILAAYDELKAEGEMTVRVNEQCLLADLAELERFLSAGYQTGWGDEWLRIGPLKLLTDGSLGARTAYLNAPYSDAPQTRGIAIYTQEELDALILKAHCGGMQIAAHAIGDAAADMVLHAVEKAQAFCPRKNMRHGIVHAQIFTPDQVRRMKSLDMHAYIQPIFLDYDTQIVFERLGERALKAYPAASLHENGVTFSSGSDCPVEPPDVFEGLQCAVTRKPVTRRAKQAYLPHEALTLDLALQSFSAFGAYASFEEHLKGRIQAGFLADFTVLDQNPFETDPKKIHLIRPTAVYVHGKRIL